MPSDFLVAGSRLGFLVASSPQPQPTSPPHDQSRGASDPDSQWIERPEAPLEPPIGNADAVLTGGFPFALFHANHDLWLVS